MNRYLLAGVIMAVLVATAASPAHADGVGFRGMCRVAIVEDDTPDGSLGGSGVLQGEGNIAVVANDFGRISANCSIKVNGADQGVFLYAGSSTGVVAMAGPVTIYAWDTDIVSVCTNVTTSAGAESVCVDLSTAPLCPDQVCAEGGLLDQINPEVTSLEKTVRSFVGPTTPTYSSLCDNGLQVVDQSVEGIHMKVYIRQPSAQELDVCVRAEEILSGSGIGGEFVIMSTVMPGIGELGFGLPTTDTSSGLCTSTTPNQVPGAHPIDATSVAGQALLVDAYADGTEAWVCVTAGSSVNERIIIPVAVPSPTITPGTPIAFNPDPQAP